MHLKAYLPLYYSAQLQCLQKHLKDNFALKIIFLIFVESINDAASPTKKSASFL